MDSYSFSGLPSFFLPLLCVSLFLYLSIYLSLSYTRTHTRTRTHTLKEHKYWEGGMEGREQSHRLRFKVCPWDGALLSGGLARREQPGLLKGSVVGSLSLLPSAEMLKSPLLGHTDQYKLFNVFNESSLMLSGCPPATGLTWEEQETELQTDNYPRDNTSDLLLAECELFS